MSENMFGDRRHVPFVFAVVLAVGLSVFAYAGYMPLAVSARGVDKVLHLGMSFALTLALERALRGRALLAGGAVFAVLATDEYLQRFSAYRSSDWKDLAADVLGIGLAVWLATALRRRPVAAA